MTNINILLVLVLVSVLSGCASDKEIIKSSCSPPDNKNYVQGDGECLRIKTVNAMNKPKALIILIHGDISGGGASDYFHRRASRVNPELNDFVVVTLVRPGYYDSDGKYSTGDKTNRKELYSEHKVDAIASAIRNLKAFYQPIKTIVAGHSGGATITGNIIGRYPSFIDGAVLAACACDLEKWRASIGRQWSNNLSPITLVNAVRDTKVVAIAGGNDSNTFPELMSTYIQELKDRGIEASFQLLDGVSHNGTARSDEFFAAIVDLAK